MLSFALGSRRESAGAEADAASVGMDPDALERAVDLVRARSARSQLHVIRRGEVVLDRSFGCDADALFWTFSACKPYPALLVHLLAERGQLGLDEPIAAHWPRFGRNGKERVTVRHVLQHRSGILTPGGTLGDALTMTSWGLFAARIEAARLRWEPGEAPAYEPISYGFILGELLERVTGRPFVDLVRSEIIEPLGLRDSHFGLPVELWDRHVDVRGEGLAAGIAGRGVNRRQVRAAVIPAAGLSTTARDLGALYRALLADGQEQQGRILSAHTLQAALVPSSDGELDRGTRSHIRWSQGFQLGGPRGHEGAYTPMGERSSPLAFGHNGSNCCMAWADPERELVFAYTSDRLQDGERAKRHLADLADAVIGACEEAA